MCIYETNLRLIFCLICSMVFLVKISKMLVFLYKIRYSITKRGKIMFRNRGEIPNISTNSENNDGYNVPHYSHYWTGRFIIIQYDKTFVAIELISVMLILLIVLAVYLFSYPISFEDPLATMKNNFLTAQLIAVVGSLVGIGLVTFLTKSSKEKLIRNLRIVGLLSMIILIVLWIAKLKVDTTYNKEEVFRNFYEQYEAKDNGKKMDLKLSGMKLVNEKEAYIKESQNAYTNFSVKVIMYLIVQLIMILILFYLSYRLSVREMKKEKLAKDDAILYDEEENIKF